MKKLFLSLVTIVAVIAGTVPANVSAAGSSLWLSPVSRVVVPGQIFTVTVTLLPAGATIYTAKASIKFPANLIEARAFTFVNGWLPLTQPGYDAIDNTNGVVVKSAGFPGGITTNKVLGTITFRAKALGIATIAADGATLLLDSSSANAYTGSNQATATIRAGTIPPAPTSPSPSASATPEISGTTDQEAAVGLFAGGSGTGWVIGILALAVLTLSWLLIRRGKSGSSQ